MISDDVKHLKYYQNDEILSYYNKSLYFKTKQNCKKKTKEKND